jgi:hypothetical protein
MAKSASIKHVQTAMDGQQHIGREEYQYAPPPVEVSDFNLEYADRDKPVKRFVIYKLVNNRKKGRVNLPGEADVYNTETKKIERVRLLLGVDSIWKRLQKDVPEQYVKENLRSIIFENRIARIDVMDAQGLEFMRVNNSFTENPHRRAGGKYDFFEWNPERQEKEAYERENFENDMVVLAANQPFDKVRKHALFLGVRFNDELGEAKTEPGIRRDYQIMARRNPQRFRDTMDTKEVEVHYLVRKALNDTMIDVNGRERDAAYWSNGGGRICKIPSGSMSNSLKYLTDLALTNSDEGRAFLDQLQTRIK